MRLRRQTIESFPDPTHTSLEAAFLDQKVAGQFHGMDYVYVPSLMDNGMWCVGIAVANEDGHYPIRGSSEFEFDRFDLCVIFCHGMNRHIRVPLDHVAEIIASTMGGRTYRGRP